MGVLSESQETFCSRFQEISKSENLDKIKSIQLRVSHMRLKLNSVTEKTLSPSQLKIFKDELLEYKKKYWIDLHFKTRQSIDSRLALIESKLKNNECSKRKKNRSTRNTPRSNNNNNTVEKVYNTRSKIKTMCREQSEMIKKKSTFNNNSKPKNLASKSKKKNIKCNTRLNQTQYFEKPNKSLLSNTFPQENITSGFDYGTFLPKTQPIPKTNFFTNIFSDIQQKNSVIKKDYYDDELNNLNLPSSAETYNTVPYNSKPKVSIEEKVFYLTEPHCRKLAKSLKLSESFLINQIRNILENDEIDEFDDVSVIGPSQSPITYKVWKSQRLNRTKVSLNTELEHFNNYFDNDDIEFDLQIF